MRPVDWESWVHGAWCGVWLAIAARAAWRLWGPRRRHFCFEPHDGRLPPLIQRLDLETRLAYEVAWKLRDMAIVHRRTCHDPNCTRRGEILAYLAHVMHCAKADLLAVPRRLLEYDLRCDNQPECLLRHTCGQPEYSKPLVSPPPRRHHRP